jgi:hypothetical protein
MFWKLDLFSSSGEVGEVLTLLRPLKTPWMVDQSISRPLPAYDNTNIVDIRGTSTK